jgi:hypothetical protein
MFKRKNPQPLSARCPAITPRSFPVGKSDPESA